MTTSPRERRPEARRSATRGQRRWPLALALVAAAVVVGALLLGLTGRAAGALAAERTEHAFGTVRMRDGLLATSFPLTVEGAVEVTDLGTT